MSLDLTQIPTKLDHSGEFQVGKYTVAYDSGRWELDVSCDIVVNELTVQVVFPVMHSSDYAMGPDRQMREIAGCWKRGQAGATASHNGQSLWDASKPGKIRTAFKKELPTAVVMQGIAHACDSFLAAVNKPETWLDELFYSRRLRRLQDEAQAQLQSFQLLAVKAEQRVAALQQLLEKPTTEKINLFYKYGSVLSESELAGFLDRDRRQLRQQMLEELGIVRDETGVGAVQGCNKAGSDLAHDGNTA